MWSSSRLCRGGVRVNSAFFKKTVESSSRLVHVVKTEWGVDANSAKEEFKRTPQRGSSCELRIFQKPNGEFQKCRVPLNSPLCFWKMRNSHKLPLCGVCLNSHSVFTKCGVHFNSPLHFYTIFSPLEPPTVFLKVAESAWTLHCVFAKCGVHMNSPSAEFTWTPIVFLKDAEFKRTPLYVLQKCRVCFNFPFVFTKCGVHWNSPLCL